MSDNEKTLALLAALVGVRASGPRKVQRPRMADEIVRLRDENAALRAEIDRLHRIFAALREPSSNVIESANVAFPFAAPMIRAAVAAAEKEVG